MRSRRNGIGLDYASRPRTRFVMAVSNRSNLNQAQIVKPTIKHTVRNLHFLSKNSTLISRENCRVFGVKNS